MYCIKRVSSNYSYSIVLWNHIKMILRKEGNFCCTRSARSLTVYSTVSRIPTGTSVDRHKFRSFIRLFNSSANLYEWKKDQLLQDSLVLSDELFQASDTKDKDAFLLAIDIFKKNESIRREHMAFIYSCLQNVEKFGVQEDLEVYKAIMKVFPPERFVPRNMIQVGFFHFPRHQQCAIDILDTMENHGVCPDEDMKQIIIDRFGKVGDVFYKFSRMLYWFPKFKHMSPFPLPEKLPKDPMELAKLAIKRMMVDLQSTITIYESDKLIDSLDKTWIVSGQSPLQQKLISAQKDNVPFYVDGPFFIWLKLFSITYFILKADNPKALIPKEEVDNDDISNLESEILNPHKVKELVDTTTVHEQEDGNVLGVCATGTSSRDSLLSWIRFLQESNPRLKSNPVIFTLKAPSMDLITVNNQEKEVVAKAAHVEF